MLNTPVPNVSRRGVPFSHYGWKASRFNTLHAVMRSKTGFPDKDHWIDAPVKDVEHKLKELGRFDSYDCSFEFAIHSVKEGLNKTEALFYLIRNGFAHGGFNKSKYKNEYFYAFENRQGSTLKGRAVLREATLLAWKEAVTSGYNKNIELADRPIEPVYIDV